MKLTRTQLFILIIGLALMSAGVFLVYAGKWLLVENPVPDKLDVVFTFAGDGARVNYSRELMGRNPAAHWLLSDYKNGYARLLRKDGFDMNRVSSVDTCSSTQSEVAVLDSWIKTGKIEKALMLSHNDGSKTIPASYGKSQILHVGLVSSPYHMRRIQMMVNWTDLRDSVQFYYLPVPLDRYNWNRKMFGSWWKHKNLRTIVISELQKIGYFLLTA